MKRKITRLAVAVLLAVLMSLCGQMERYTLEVIATSDIIEAHDIHGEAVSLTVCRASDGQAVLLTDVESGHRYTVTLDRNETWNTEDDAIIRVVERSEDR